MLRVLFAETSGCEMRASRRAGGLTLTSHCAGGTNPVAGPSTYRRTMWRLSNAQALIFVAAVVIMVALAVWMAL